MNGRMTGEITLFAGPRIPAGWLPCRGQELPIESNKALFVQIGTAYGGDGKITFALPDLRNRIPVAAGTEPPWEFASSGDLGVGDGGTQLGYGYLALNYIIKL